MHTYRFVLMMFQQNIKRRKNQFIQTYRTKVVIKKDKKNVAHYNKTPMKNQRFHILCVIRSFSLYLKNHQKKVPQFGKYAVQTTSFEGHGNQGSATIEAVCIMPLMLFAFWAFYSMGQIYILENQIYQSAMNTAGYLAEYAYLTEEIEQNEDPQLGTQLLGMGIAKGKLSNYLEDKRRVEQYVVGGMNGFMITSPIILDDEGFINLQIRYQVRVPVPLLKNLSFPICVQVRQKAFTGYKEEEEGKQEEQYVYIAEYSTVYHLSRNCSHLKLTIIPVTESVLQSTYGNLASCNYCGDESATVYYITETGDCYHTSVHCTGLKRTVRRVRLNEVEGYAPCSRCGSNYE